MAKILIVDDDKFIREMISIYLCEQDHDLSFAENGEIAVEQGLQIQPDIIVTDLDMPVMNGYTAIAQLRNHDFKGIIIIVSTESKPEKIALAIQSGGDYFIPKPINSTFEKQMNAIFKEHNF